jgi:hypothetical protein
MADKILWSCVVAILVILMIARVASSQYQHGLAEGYVLGYNAADTSTVERNYK